MKVEVISLHDWFGTWHENIHVGVNPRNLDELAQGLRIDLNKPSYFYSTLRAVVDSATKDAYIWCAGKGTHDAVAEQLGLNYKACYYQNIIYNDSKWTAEWMSGPETGGDDYETMLQCMEKIAKVFDIDISDWYISSEPLVNP